MLKKLYIKNYALIDEMTIDFGSGLNILTGETGAGKSIIIGALSLLLGEKVKSDVIRKGASMAVVEGVFDVPDSEKWNTIINNQFEMSDDELLLRREIHQSGRSRSFANDSPIPNSLLSTIGDLLVDLHGQHAHQTLLKVERHLDYLDNFGVDKNLLTQLKESVKKFRSLNAELSNLKQKEKQLQEKQDLIEFQVEEIARANLRDGEEEELELEERILQNSEKLFEASNQINELLYEGEGSVSEKLSLAENTLAGLTGVDQVFEKWVKEAESARIIVEELVNNIQTYVSKVEFNPQRLEEIRERLGLFTRLKKKYGPTIKEVINFWEKAKRELSQIENIEDEITGLSTAMEQERKKLSQIAADVSAQRKHAASELEKRTVKALEELGLKNSLFRILLKQKDDPDGPVEIDGKHYAVSTQGIDTAEFLVSLNPGEDPKPLAKVASGGEISRIMLSLKVVLAEADEIPILVFDEIDSGISGRIARVVGKNLKEVAKKRQVICITHLPQIASMGDFHFSVEKKIEANRTRTTVHPLNEEQKVIEIAKLIGGENVTESAMQSARELLES